MEPMRSSLPKNNFLNEVRKLANKYKCILIFDEITSGFHDHYGGVHLKLNVIPDIAIFGKSIANGYPISAIIGKKKIMNKSQDSFISSTMWTDKIGFVASIKTLQYMKKNKVQTKIVKIGKSIKKFWEKSCQKHNVKIVISGQNSMPYISFGYNNNLEISTFFTQEMLKKGFLASNLVSVTEAYNDQILEKYKKNFDLVMHKISNILKKNKKFPLMGPIKHSTFKRLT